MRPRGIAEADLHLDGWLRDAARSGDVVVLYGAKDTEHDNAVVMRDHLRASGA